MNRKETVSRDDIISKAIQNSIDTFLRSNERTQRFSPRIEGEIPDVRKYIVTFGNIDSFLKNNIIIDEGLIKTYPIDKTIKYIISKYGMRSHQIQIEHMDNGIMTVDIITVILPKIIDRNTLGDIKHDFQTCGYFSNRKPLPIPDKDYFALTFEPKFSQKISDMVREKCHYLYHSSPKIYINKIIKNGLIPKSKNSLFFYPDRSFLMVGDKLNSEQINVLKNIQKTRNTHIDDNNPIETKEYVLITIDVSKLPPNIDFYCDPVGDRAIFTYDNIPPNAIAKIEPFTL